VTTYFLNVVTDMLYVGSQKCGDQRTMPTPPFFLRVIHWKMLISKTEMALFKLYSIIAPLLLYILLCYIFKMQGYITKLSLLTGMSINSNCTFISNLVRTSFTLNIYLGFKKKLDVPSNTYCMKIEWISIDKLFNVSSFKRSVQCRIISIQIC